MCDRLIAKGVAVRDRAEGGVSLSPTTAGLEVVRNISRERRGELRRIISQLSDGEQREVVPCMDAFRKAAGEIGEREWALGWWE